MATARARMDIFNFIRWVSASLMWPQYVGVFINIEYLLEASPHSLSEFSPYVLIFRKTTTNTDTAKTKEQNGASNRADSPSRSGNRRLKIIPRKPPATAAKSAATADISSATKLSPAVDFM
jgi:hypothetical protein